MSSLGKQTSVVKRMTSAVTRIPDQKPRWESFVGLWERANLIRSFLWSQVFTDEKILLTHFLTRIRRFFEVDFCFVALFFEDDQPVEIGLPETSLASLPANFASRCVDLIANSRVPVAWKQLYGNLGFSSAVVSPLTPAVGQPLGFLLLAHSTSRSFSSPELLLLQSLASELSWAIRNLRSKKNYQRLLATLSHELKNPLHLVMGHATLLRESLASLLTEEHRREFNCIDQGATELLDVVKDLLDRAASNDGKLVAVVEAIDPRLVIEEILGPFRERARRNRIDLETIYGGDMPTEIFTDPLKFKQIIRKLVDNAVKFTQRGRVQVSVRIDKGVIEVVVSDTGIGIAEEKLRAICESPRCGDSLVRPEKHGSGRGLEIVKEFAELLKGHLHVSSRVGEGAQFTVCLPCA